jgi:sensitive to high expression protein 9
MQYHEEQIWSDTIRRNSTWVTFGLMGVNILLLLVTVGVAEPWRRKRMVGEIKAALEEKMGMFEAAASSIPLAVASAEASSVPGQSVVQEEETKVAEVIVAPAEVAVAAAVEEIPAEPSIPPSAAEISEPPIPTPQTLRETAKDLFSERAVSLRQRDVSAIAIEGAATGALIAAILMGLWRSY